MSRSDYRSDGGPIRNTVNVKNSKTRNSSLQPEMSPTLSEISVSFG